MKIKLILPFILFCANICLAINPQRNYAETPKTYEFPFKELKLKTVDDVQINTWNITPQGKAKKNITIIMCGGDSGNMSYLLRPSLVLASKGYNVISFDYRGFGKSQDFKIDTNLLFYNEYLFDFEAVVKYAKKLYPKNKIGTLGYSLGGYFPLITKEKLDFMIADSPLIAPTTFLERLQLQYVQLPDKFIDPVVKPIPQLYFLGTKDRRIHIEDVPNNFAVLHKGDHVEAEYTMGDTFYTFIESLLKSLK